MRRQSKSVFILNGIKYMFSLALIVVVYVVIRDIKYFAAQLIELFGIFALSNFVLRKKKIGQVINSFLLFFFNAQLGVMIFGNSYISMLMLTNIVSIKALSGKAGIYITGFILVLLFSIIPVRRVGMKKKKEYSLYALAFYLELIFLCVFGSSYSPLYGYYSLAAQHYQTKMMEESIQSALGEGSSGQFKEGLYGDSSLSFYSESVKDHRVKAENLPEQPNIILIFTEGLSQNVVSDERNIMPNVSEYQNKSLTFSNYYNHTFATYRGLLGQLYSGYQMNDFDANRLISLQSILEEQGYQTAFLNTEPNNAEFTAYLENFGFQEMIGDTNSVCNGMADSISDKDAYEILFESAERMGESEQPFLLSTYTFGTHASLNSTDQVYQDGTDAELNKFYDVDYQFGLFMEKFENSPLYDDTIIVFTADHATYQDDSFNAAFPDYYRVKTSVDKVPLFIYYKGVTPECIEVNGRNTINLTPTILDFLDISAPNYFLGTSLFSDSPGSICETSYSDTYIWISTENAEITELKGDKLNEFNAIVQEYYITREKAALAADE